METNKPILPDFTRWQWASVPERLWWSFQFKRAAEAFLQLEKLSVVHGIRPAAWQFIPFQNLIQETSWAHQHGLILVPTGLSTAGSSYSSIGGQAIGRAPDTVRAILTHPSNYSDVLPLKNDFHIGDLLGTPPCCQKAFGETWGAGQVDNTWEQWHSLLAGSTQVHSLFRWMGIRTVPYIPCAVTCEDSARIETQFLELGMQEGFIDQIRLIKEVQAWPVEWNRLFGIAEIVSPALKITTRSDWTAEKQAFSKTGTYTKPLKEWWEDNGYTNPEVMFDVHNFLLNVLADHVTPKSHVMDLGCGNGMLLCRLKQKRKDIRISGIDINTGAISRAPVLLGNWHVGNMGSDTWWGRAKPTTVLLTPGRLLEMSEWDADYVRSVLKTIPQVILYAYSDWQKEPFTTLCQRAGFTVNTILQTPLVSAGIVVNS